MNNNFFIRLWLSLLIGVLISLIIWGVFFVQDYKFKISIFGIVAAVVTAFTSVMTVNLNNTRAREREYELYLLKEKQRVCEHFYNTFFEILTHVKKGGGVNKKSIDEMMMFKKGLINWGS